MRRAARLWTCTLVFLAFVGVATTGSATYTPCKDNPTAIECGSRKPSSVASRRAADGSMFLARVMQEPTPYHSTSPPQPTAAPDGDAPAEDGESDGEGEGIGQSKESIAGLSILLTLTLLQASLLLGWWIRKRDVPYIHEAGAALLLGLFAGLVVSAVSTSAHQLAWIKFQPDFFFLFLLPPIIFESGISMPPRPFFKNFGAICTFAFGGTLLSAFIVGIVVWLAGLAYMSVRLSFVESLIFGSLISATDPVTVLAIFQQLKVNQNLYALVFGESVLNDAVAIVMYRTLREFMIREVSAGSFFRAVGTFLGVFLGSFCIGGVIAAASALLFRHGQFRGDNSGSHDEHLTLLEVCLLLIFPYMAYMLAEGLRLSGIVSILFCGIVMSHYTIKNLSDRARDSALDFFKIAASLAETFVFIYMGITAFTLAWHWIYLAFSFWGLVAILGARAAHVFPGSKIINRVRVPIRAIPAEHQQMLWFSGLRGAVAFALSLEAAVDLPNTAHGEAMQAVTLALVVFTVLAIGGLTNTAVEKLNLRAPSPEDEESPGDVTMAHIAHRQVGGEDGGDTARRGVAHGSRKFEGAWSGQGNGDSTPMSPGGTLAQRALAVATNLKDRTTAVAEALPTFEMLDQRYLQPLFVGGSVPPTAAATPAPRRQGAEGVAADHAAQQQRRAEEGRPLMRPADGPASDALEHVAVDERDGWEDDRGSSGPEGDGDAPVTRDCVSEVSGVSVGPGPSSSARPRRGNSANRKASD
ncbi:unnamed protein product [Pedinophyceae sp. YPF-701]|nr:unnamed protein product [Pedinophyceae sp. YPF-701]